MKMYMKCIRGSMNLTEGKVYEVRAYPGKPYFSMTNDRGRQMTANKERFDYPHSAEIAEHLHPIPKDVPKVNVLTLDIPKGATTVVISMREDGASWTWDCVA